MAGTLVATRYVPPGSFIGQLITPRPGQVSPEARIPCYIGRGSRLALGQNIPILRAFIFAEQLTFSVNAPFVATLSHNSDADQENARLFRTDGTEVRNDQWSFQSTGGGTNNQVLINTEVYDASVTYFLDYQSTDRTVKDPVPIEELREIVSMGNRVDNPQYVEYTHFFIETEVTASAPDPLNMSPDPVLSPIAPDGGNTGAGTLAFASSAEFDHDYTRLYGVEVTGQTSGVFATGTLTAIAGGAITEPTDNFILDDGVNPAVTFEFDSDASVTETDTLRRVIFAGGDADTVVAAAIQTAINAAPTLDLTCGAPAGAVVTITADNYGTAANQAIVENMGATLNPSGMASGAAREIDFEWTATAESPGNTALPNVPLHTTGTNPTLTVTDDDVGSFTPLLELGVRLEWAFAGGATPPYDVGDTFQFLGYGPGLFEADIRHSNTNQFATIEDPVADSGNSGAAGTDLAIAATADFSGTYNANYTVEVASFVGTTPGTRTTTFLWGEAGDHVNISGTFLADEATPASLTQTLSKGVDIDIEYPTGAGNFAVGDKFTFSGLAPRELYQGKDSRTYTLTTTSTSSAAGSGGVTGTYQTDTPEGGFGTFEATGNNLVVTNPLFEDGHFTLPNNVLMAARNLFRSLNASGNRHDAADAHTFAATQSGQIDWTLNELASETVEADQILTDTNGSVTGTPGTRYIILSQTPLEATFPTPHTSTDVVTLAGSTPVTHTHLVGTPYITFLSDPGEAVVVAYEWRNAEPDPGQTYYLTAKFLRPPEAYNTPTLILDRQDGRNALAPASVDNHLYTMNEIAWDNGTPALYYVQVQDPDEDGIYTDADFAEAILASEAPRRITDIVVLGQFSSLGAAANSVTKMNDPFERRERLLWVGMPIGTPIGDAETPDTIVYTARNTLQVYGNSPAHGTRILTGSTQATREIRLEDGQTVTVTMDGSFVAGALAALVDSFQDPGDTILRKSLAGFQTLETYGDIEDPRNLTLGAAQVVFLTDQGGGVFRIEEDETVDSFADDFKNINAMTQKQFVTRNIRTQVDQSLIGIVVPSAQAGIGLVKGFVVGAVNTLVSRGIVARFQDEDGNERPIDPDADVVVFRDETDPTLYRLFFAYYLKTVIKRVFGLYSVGTNDFGLLRG